MRSWIDSRYAALAVLMVALCASPMAAGPDRRVVDAAKRDDLKAVEEAIRQKADVNAAQPDGATPIHWAAHHGDLPIAEALIKAGVNVNVTEEGGVTPLALAAMNGDAAMTARLIRAGAQPNLGRETAVLVAARTGAVPVMQLLLDAGGDANAKESLRGQTALMWAAAERHPAAVKLLIAKGADVNAKTEGKDAPQGGTMRQGASPPPSDGNGTSNGSAAGANRPNAAGMRQARNAPAANGANGYSAVMFAARAGDLETVRTLLDAGANVNDIGRDGLNPLLLATHRGYAKLAMFLLDHGASAKYDGAGYTALHWAVGSWETELTVTSISPDREDEEWRTVAGLREGRLELVKALIAHGADVNARIIRTPQRVGSSKNPGLPELEGATPFIIAAVGGEVEVMRELVAQNADVHLKTKQNATPLMAAAGMGRVIGEVAVPEARMLDAAKYLFELGDPDVNAVDELGNSALHYAAFMRRDGIVQLLADKGGRLDGRNKWGETPLFLAEVVFQFAGGGRFESGPTSTGTLLRKLGAQPSKPDYTLRPLYWPNIPHV
jgi:ankyrin repeat protein